ncbi:MAG: VWA domain-containing protein [Candidatus Omnitrophota bacterium]
MMRMAALILFLIALAGPRSVLDFSEFKTEGIDIVLATDVSGSMAAEDFILQGQRRNRLEVVKAVMREFVQARRSDRIGMVAFAREAYTVSPLTTDQNWLLLNLDRLDLGLIEDGTAVGSGLSSALVRLKNSNARSKAVILLTDGVNNAGQIQPLEAAGIAKAMGIKVYTIGAGTRGPVPFPVADIWGRKQYQAVQIDIDEETLKKIASETGGHYFRADNTEALREVYRAIDQMEKTEIKQYGYREYRELFPFFLSAGLLLLFAGLLLENTWLMVLP